MGAEYRLKTLSGAPAGQLLKTPNTEKFADLSRLFIDDPLAHLTNMPYIKLSTAAWVVYRTVYIDSTLCCQCKCSNLPMNDEYESTSNSAGR